MEFNSFVEPIYGNLPDKWSLTNIGKLENEGCADIQTGPFGTMLHAKSYVPVGTPVVAVKHIGENRLRHVDLPRIGPEDRTRLARYVLHEDDLVFGRKGAVERRAYVTSVEKGWIQGSDCIRVRFTSPEKVNAKFISYVLGSSAYYEWIMRNAQGATMPSLNQEIIRRIPLPLPPLPEQCAIARILGALDDKIELNRRMNQTLEEMARAIFKSWFVDFDPVRAKMEGRAPAGMDAETAALFPDGFEESELGMVPRGWKVARIEDLCTSIENGGTPRRKEKDYWEDGTIQWFKTGELTDGPLVESEEKITDLGLSKSSCKLWNPSTILIALYASPTVGRLGILDVPATANQACSALVAKQEYGNLFLFHSLFATRDHLQQIAVGAAQQNISQKVVRDHRIIAPTASVAFAFQAFAARFYALQVKNHKEARTLAAIRDALLPKLISGEIRVEGAERVAAPSA